MFIKHSKISLHPNRRYKLRLKKKHIEWISHPIHAHFLQELIILPSRKQSLQFRFILDGSISGWQTERSEASTTELRGIRGDSAGNPIGHTSERHTHDAGNEFALGRYNNTGIYNQLKATLIIKKERDLTSKLYILQKETVHKMSILFA